MGLVIIGIILGAILGVIITGSIEQTSRWVGFFGGGTAGGLLLGIFGGRRQ